MASFEGLTAMITGGAGGLGQALAKALVRRGARVALADISEEAARAAAEPFGAAARGYGCDVSDRAEVEALSAAVARDFGGVNLVFVNAGVAVGGRLTDTDPREFDWMFDVNVRGAFHTIQAFAPTLAETAARGGQARFVLTGSENSVGLPTTGIMTAYTATKHAVLALADGLRRDLEGSGVEVSIFCPGLVNTQIWNARRARQARYGGPAQAPPEAAAAAVQAMAAHGQDPDLTAALCLEGIEAGEFLIITDPKIRDFASRRHAEVEAALDRLDARLARTKPSPVPSATAPR